MAKTIKTVGELVELIRQGTVSGNAQLEQHSKTLLGPRDRGSSTEIGLEDVPNSIGLEPVQEACVREGCDCYRFSFPMGGRVGAMRFGKLFAYGYVVKLRDGEHGPELYVDTPVSMDKVQTNDIYVIVGDFGGQDAVFTWHPGKPLGDLKDGIQPTTGVKLENVIVREPEPVVTEQAMSEPTQPEQSGAVTEQTVTEQAEPVVLAQQ